MVEHQTDRMVMVGFAVLMFGILAIVFRKGIKSIMDLVVEKVNKLITNATNTADNDSDIKDPDVPKATNPNASKG